MILKMIYNEIKIFKLNNKEITINIIMTNVFDLYKKLPVCCYGMKTEVKLLKKYNRFFSYIICDNDTQNCISNYSAEQLYEKYIEFIDNNTISRTLVEKLRNVDEWLNVYPTEEAIRQAFSKLDVGCGCSGGYNNIRTYAERLIDMLFEYRVVQLTLLEPYANIHTDNSFYEHLDEISLKPRLSKKTIYNGSMDCDGFCDVDITIYYDMISNAYMRADRLCWQKDVVYEKYVPEYCDIDTIKDTIIPCYDCRMGKKCQMCEC